MSFNSYISNYVNDVSSTSTTRSQPSITLYNYQIKAIDKMKRRNNNLLKGVTGGIVQLKMGAGKSIIVIAHAKLVKSFNLIVCNNAVLGEWKENLDKYGNCKYYIYHKNFNKQLPPISSLKNNEFIITTYETINKHYNTTLDGVTENDSLHSLKFDNIYLDESHRIANSKTVCYSACMCLKGRMKWCITGSPIRNYSTDLLSQFKFMGYTEDTLLEAEFEKYKLHDCIIDIDIEEIKSEIEYPEFVVKTHKLDLSDTEVEIYNTYRGISRNVYNGFLRGKYTYAALFTCIMKLRQIAISPRLLTNGVRGETSNGVSNEDEKSVRIGAEEEKLTSFQKLWIQNNHSTKIKKIIEIINNIPQNEKCLIFTMFTEAIHCIEEVLTSDKKTYVVLNGSVTGNKRVNNIDKFKNDDDTQFFIIHTKVGGEGLNLIAANHVIIVENWWTDCVETQAMYRAIRIGQNKKVTVHKLLVNNSIEERVEDTKMRKLELNNKFVKLDSKQLKRMIE